MSPACLTLVHPPHNTRASHMSRLSRRYTRAVYSVRVRLALRYIHGLASSCTHAVHLVRVGWGGVGWGWLVAGGRCARPAWPAPEMGRSGAGPWAARCCRGGRPGAMPGRHVEESRPCPSGPRRRRGVRGARGRAGGRSYGGGVCWSAGRTARQPSSSSTTTAGCNARQPLQLLHERLHHLHQALLRPGALLGNHFIFIIFIKYSYYDG